MPPTRHATWWTVALAISLAVTLAGGGGIAWAVYHDLRSPGVISLGLTLLAVGFAATVSCLGARLAIRGRPGPRDG